MSIEVSTDLLGVLTVQLPNWVSLILGLLEALGLAVGGLLSGRWLWRRSRVNRRVNRRLDDLRLRRIMGIA